MSTTDEIITESFRLIRAQERVGAMLGPVELLSDQIDRVLEFYPELAPEMHAARTRLSESLEHIRSALDVLQAKVDVL